MGDFNIDLAKIDTRIESENFLNTLVSYYFQPFILQPTRITDHSATLIDNIFLNSIEHSIISGNIVYDLTDHLPNFIIINKLLDTTDDVNCFRRDYSKFNEENFIHDMSQINWQHVLYPNSGPSDMFNRFYSKLLEKVDEYVPLKKVSKNELKFLSKPWITSGIKKSIKTKNKIYHKYLKTKSTYYLCKFKIYRNKINHLLKISKKTYYNEYFQKYSKDGKMLWNGIKTIVNYKLKKKQNINEITVNDTSITDSKTIAEEFNKYFSLVGPNLESNIPIVDKIPHDYLIRPSKDSFYIFPVTKDEVEKEIACLKNNKSTGPYSVPIKLLKLIKYIISKPLEQIFNLCFAKGVVPDNMKIANVIPIHKKDSQLLVSNYRPISLLSGFSKLLEKLMASRLTSFLEKNKILFENQFGFRSNHSTDHAVLSIVEKIQSAIDNSDYSCGIFLDLRKAFDTVNHKILIEKLDYYGIRGITKEWFLSYLNNRKQFVTINDISSELKNITTGIPQGSVLGPILFLIYINDFHLCSNFFDFHLFADDANLFCRNKQADVLQQQINNELNEVHTWFCANKLSLNIEKSNFVLFHSRQKKSVETFKIEFYNIPLKQENCIKYLGIYIDSHLTWKQHVQYISKKIKRNIGILSKLRYYVNIEVLTNLYYALIYPFLIYGVLSWGTTYQTTLQPLFILQKKALRLITFSPFDAHTSPIFKRLSILKLYDLTNYCIAVFMFKLNNNLLPHKFQLLFKKVSDVHMYHTRSATKQNLYLPKARTNFGKFNIKYIGSKIWNSLDNCCRNKKKI